MVNGDGNGYGNGNGNGNGDGYGDGDGDGNGYGAGAGNGDGNGDGDGYGYGDGDGNGNGYLADFDLPKNIRIDSITLQNIYFAWAYTVATTDQERESIQAIIELSQETTT